jgi:hypothetical protein
LVEKNRKKVIATKILVYFDEPNDFKGISEPVAVMAPMPSLLQQHYDEWIEDLEDKNEW